MVSDHFKKYLTHPRLVKSGVDGLPDLVPGRFYMIVSSSHRATRYMDPPNQIWLCESGPTDHSEYSRSYGMLAPGLFDTGQTYMGFCYKWFGKGDNIIIDLREEQQAAHRAFQKALEADTHNEFWDWSPRD